MRKHKLISLLIAAVSLSAQTTTTITVQASLPKHTVSPLLFGGNVEWWHDGDYLWDTANQRLRPELVAAFQGVKSLRFPGGTLADFYQWRNGIGPRAQRPVSPHGVDGDSSPNEFGFHEFMDLCAQTGATPIVQVNIATATLEEALDWVHYANDQEHPERAANGHPAPYGVVYWEVGNEPYITDFWNPDPATIMTAEAYADRLVAFASAMKSADPNIKIIAATGKNFGSYSIVRQENWHTVVLSRAAAVIDILATHNGYSPLVLTGAPPSFDTAYRAMLSFPLQVQSNLSTLGAEIATAVPAHSNRLKLAVTEWGPLFSVFPSSGFVGHPKTLGSGVFAASLLRAMIEDSRVTVGTLFQAEEPLFLGSIYHTGVKKPTALALDLLAQHSGRAVLTTTFSGPKITTSAAGFVATQSNVPLIEATATDGGSDILVTVINRDLYYSRPVKLVIKNATIQGTGTISQLTGYAPDSNNGNDLLPAPGLNWAPQTVSPVRTGFNAGKPGDVVITTINSPMAGTMTFTVPAMSVTNLRLPK